jgi:gliding motility-associated-like protein
MSKQIFVDMQEGLFVPNSFVPESHSPMLEKFQPRGYNLETYKISIYDTWGNLLWYSDKLHNGAPSEGWDGTYNGTVLKMDSYIWKIEATFQDGTTWEGQGSSTSDKKKTMGNVLMVR